MPERESLAVCSLLANSIIFNAIAAAVNRVLIVDDVLHQSLNDCEADASPELVNFGATCKET